MITQLTVEEQPQDILEQKNVEEEEELQQPPTSDLGEAFFQDLFQEEHVHNIVFQCAISYAKSMMKRKGKVVVEVLVAYERPIQKHS